MRRLTCHFSGDVQGVGFRQTARSHARGFADLTGYVRNLPDGRVEMVVEGPDARTEQFINAVVSAMSENVREVERAAAPATGEFDRFAIRH